MSRLFTGSCVALVTPFTDTGVDYDKLGELIEFQIANKTDAILVCGTTGESSTQTTEEHIDVIKYAVEKVKGRVPVIAGTGSNETAYAIELNQASEEAGVDGVLMVTPYYNKTTQKGLYEHYKIVAEETKLPIILYNVPSRTGLNISAETVAKLAEIDNIVGIKEASGNISHVAKIAQLTEGKFDIYAGNDDQVVPTLSLGGVGVISTMANVVPTETHEMVSAYLSGDVKKATEYQLRLLDLIDALFIEVNPIPVKTALNMMGYHVGPCRRPLAEMEEKNAILLKETLLKYGLIK